MIIPPLVFPISKEFHANNRARFLQRLNIKEGILLLQGAVSIDIADDDQQYQIDQESNFHYLFGVQELDCYGVLELDTGKAIVFVPHFPNEYKMWMAVYDNEHIRTSNNLDEVHYVSELETYLKNKSPKIYFHSGIDSDSKLKLEVPTLPFLSAYETDSETVYPILNECRVFKSDEEIKIMKHVAEVSSRSHIEVMQRIKAGNKEYQMEALFKYKNLLTAGCKQKPYNCICAHSTGASILDYSVNDKVIAENSLVLNDMGGKYYGYCSDITVTFPISGVFSEKQALIYNLVLDAHQQVIKNIHIGVNWGDLHLLALKVITTHLHKIQIIQGDLDKAIEQHVGAIFFPHGLGHFVGLRVHDVGGYNPGHPQRHQDMRFLRFRRNLEAGMVFTVEPGCYFSDPIIEQGIQKHQQFLNIPLIEQFKEVGGVRLEDVVVLHQHGPEVISKVPRTIQQVEACIRGEEWQI